MANVSPALQPGIRMPFYPPLPWLSVEGAVFPPRASQRRRKRKAPIPAQGTGLALPSREQPAESEAAAAEPTEVLEEADHASTVEPESRASTLAPASEAGIDTPSTSHPPSELDPADNLTQSPAALAQAPPTAAPSHARSQTKPAVPLIPIRSAKAPSVASATQKSVATDKVEAKTANATPATSAPETSGTTEETPKASPPPKATPKSWAELLRSKNAAATSQAPPSPNGVPPTNGVAPKSNSLGDALASFSVDSDKKLSFLEPRGLVNTGNLCYMNSVSGNLFVLSGPS